SPLPLHSFFTIHPRQPRSTLFPYTTLFRSTRVVAEAWNEWTRSQADATRRRQRKADGGGGATIAELVVETQHADPRYLEMVLKRSEEHTSELQSRGHLVCRLLLEKKKKKTC